MGAGEAIAQRLQWCESLEPLLAKAAGNDLDIIKAEVMENKAQLWALSGAAKGYVVTRVESYDSYKELVIVLGVGSGAKAGIEWVKRLAKSYGIESIRTHIKRPGLARMYKAAGFYQREIVMGLDCGIEK